MSLNNMDDPIWADLKKRLKKASNLFISANFYECIVLSRTLLDELDAITNSPLNPMGPLSSIAENRSPHVCSRKPCLCEPISALLIQCLYELGCDREAFDAWISESCFINPDNLPFVPFTLAMQLLCAQNELNYVRELVISYIMKHQAKRATGKRHRYAVVLEPPLTLSSNQYDELVELLVFHVLIPLHTPIEVIRQFVEENNMLSTFRRDEWKRVVQEHAALVKPVALDNDVSASPTPSPEESKTPTKKEAKKQEHPVTTLVQRLLHIAIRLRDSPRFLMWMTAFILLSYHRRKLRGTMLGYILEMLSTQFQAMLKSSSFGRLFY